MPDSKITALTSISTSTDPANDPLVIVDVSDTSMAATGTTKKVTLNNLLACSPTAGGNFTITGDLTVRTNQLVVNSSGSFVGKSAGAVGTDGVQLLASGFSGFSASGTTALFVNRNTSDGTVLQLGRSGASAADFGAIAGGGFTVGLSGSEWMRINSTGLGVGTASPAQKVDVNGAVLATNVYLRSDDSDVSWGAGAGSRPIIRGNQTNNTIKFYTASTDRMTLDASGNLGIGVQPSVSKLHVGITSTATSGLAEANALKIENNNATVNNAAGLFLSQTGDAGCGIAGIATSRTGGSRTSDLVLYYYNQATSASPIEGLRLTSTGQVGIGVTPSAWRSTVRALQIGGVGALYGSTATTGAVSISRNAYDSATGGTYISNDEATLYEQDQLGRHVWYNAPAATGTISWQQAMTLDASGRLLVGPTSANTSGGVLQLSSGITFPATQVASSDPNTLDDYEEGTWTPVVADATTGGNVGTFVNNGSTYTKIGRQVSVQTYISSINTTGMTGANAIRIRGLPFTAAKGGHGNFYTYRVGRNASTVSSSVSVNDNASWIQFGLYSSNSATTDLFILVSDIVSGTSEIMLSLTYFV